MPDPLRSIFDTPLLLAALIVIAVIFILWFLKWLLFPEYKVTTERGQGLQGLQGMDDKLASRLRSFGVDSDRKLVQLNSRGQLELESQLGLEDGQYGQWKEQIIERWRKKYLPPELRERVDLHPDPDLGAVYLRRPERIDDFTKLPGIDSIKASRMQAAGLYTFEQLLLLTPEQRRAVQLRFGISSPDLDHWPAAIDECVQIARMKNPAGLASNQAAATTSPSRTNEPHHEAGASANMTTACQTSSSGDGAERPTTRIDVDLGEVYTLPPSDADDLTQLEGIDRAAADRLNAAGIFKLDQLCALSDQQQANVKSRFGLPQIDFSKWTLPAGAAAAVAGLVSGASSDTTRIDADLGRVYKTPPNHRDELTQLEGIDQAAERRLNEAGIYTVEQLRSLNTDQQARFRRRFGLPLVDFSKWQLPQESPTTDRASHASGPASGGPARRATGAPTGVTAQYRPTAPRSEAEAIVPPRESTTTIASPSQPTESSPGKGPSAQSATSGTSAAAPVSPTTSKPGREVTGRIVGFASATGRSGLQPSSADPKDDIGLVYARRPGRCDDLTRLYGIDEGVASKLNAAGIYTYQQIRDLNPSQRAALQRRFGIGQIDFTDWNRCIAAWSKGIETTSEPPRASAAGWLHGIRLPEIVPGVFNGSQLVAYPEQVVFRGSDPEPWGTVAPNPMDGAARSQPAEAIRNDANYVRIRRLDNRDSVVTAITKGQLFAPGDGTRGWNGLCESFFGGRHLGIYHSDVPNEVETKFGIGGWGFGHRYHENDQQQCSWAGRYIEPTAMEISVGRIGPSLGTIVFRGSDPSIWNSAVSEEPRRLAIPLAKVTHPINYVRLMRVDTGEAVAIRVDESTILQLGDDGRAGWNGLNDHFSGGHHLGMYHQDAAQHVETRFGVGGWGFGHPFGDNDRQAYGWGGMRLPETVFEISVLEKVPEYLQHELLQS